MSSNCKVLKVLSLLLVLAGIVFAVLGVITIVGGTNPEVVSTAQQLGLADADTLAAVTRVYGFGQIFSGALTVLVGFLGVRGANRPSKVTPFVVLVVIGLVLNAVSLVANLVTGQTVTPTHVLTIVVLLFAAVLGFRVRGEAKSK